MPLGLCSTSFSKYFTIQRAGKCLHLQVWGIVRMRMLHHMDSELFGFVHLWNCVWKPFDPRFVFFFSLRDDLVSALSSSSPAVVKVNVNPGLVNVKRDFPKTEIKCIQVVHNKSKFWDFKVSFDYKYAAAATILPQKLSCYSCNSYSSGPSLQVSTVTSFLRT